MRQWIRFWGLGLIIIIVLGWYLCIDWIVKTSIETLATEANGAKVELDSVTLTLLPTSLKLSGLQVTDPENPMSNLISADDISAQLDGLMLLRRQVIIDNATLAGLKFNSPRTNSGATNTIKQQDSDDGILSSINLGGVIPGLTLPDTDQLLKKQEQHLKDEIGKIETRLEAIEQRWQENLKQLPDSDKLDEYKTRWKKAKKKNFLEKISAANAIKDDIKQYLKLIKSLKKQLSRDKKLVKIELNNAKTLPAREADRLMTEVGLGGGDNSFMSAITGAQVKQWLQQGLAVFQQLSSKFQTNTEQPPEPPRGEGLWVKFPEQNPLPQVLLRELIINGELTIGNNILSFDGTGSDFAYPASDWAQPAQLTLNGKNTDGATFNASTKLDHRLPQFNDQLQLNISNLALDNITLSEQDDFALTMTKGRATIKGQTTLTPSTIDLNFNGQFKQVSLLANSEKNSTSQQLIAETLSTVDQFNLDLSAIGPITAPKVKLRSNLDSILGKSLKKQVGVQAKKLKKKLEEKIQQQLSSELNGLEGKGNYLQEIEKTIDERKKEFKQASKIIK